MSAPRRLALSFSLPPATLKRQEYLLSLSSGNMFESRVARCRELFATWGGDEAHAALPLLSCDIHRAPEALRVRRDPTSVRFVDPTWTELITTFILGCSGRFG